MHKLLMVTLLAVIIKTNNAQTSEDYIHKDGEVCTGTSRSNWLFEETRSDCQYKCKNSSLFSFNEIEIKVVSNRTAAPKEHTLGLGTEHSLEDCQYKVLSS